MIRDAYSIALDPLLPLVADRWPGRSSFLLLVGYALLRRARGALLRLLAGMALTAILLNPSLVRGAARLSEGHRAGRGRPLAQPESGEPRRRRRRDHRQAARDQRRSSRISTLRVVETKGGADHAEKGTQLFDAVREALADIPQKRLAGLVLVTDGQVHDVPAARARARHHRAGASRS